MRVIKVDWMEEGLRLVGEEGGAETITQEIFLSFYLEIANYK